MSGFDLTNIMPLKQIKKPASSFIPPTPTPQPQQEQKEQKVVGMPQSIEDALFGDIKVNGSSWKDRRPDDFKASHWSIDKFAEGPDQLPIDANGNRVIRGADAVGMPESEDHGNQQ